MGRRPGGGTAAPPRPSSNVLARRPRLGPARARGRVARLVLTITNPVYGPALAARPPLLCRQVRRETRSCCSRRHPYGVMPRVLYIHDRLDGLVVRAARGPAARYDPDSRYFSTTCILLRWFHGTRFCRSVSGVSGDIHRPASGEAFRSTAPGECGESQLAIKRGFHMAKRNRGPTPDVDSREDAMAEPNPGRYRTHRRHPTMGVSPRRDRRRIVSQSPIRGTPRAARTERSRRRTSWSRPGCQRLRGALRARSPRRRRS